MSNTIHNLDESISEYFEFTIKGITYKFRHLNTEEMEEFRKFGEDKEGGDIKAQEYMMNFITPVDETSPSFKEISKQMLIPHWKKFREMIQEEFIGNN